jgi:hypothetical protein
MSLSVLKCRPTLRKVCISFNPLLPVGIIRWRACCACNPPRTPPAHSHRTYALRLFHLLIIPPYYPRRCEEPNAVCTLKLKVKMFTELPFLWHEIYLNVYLPYILYELTGRLVASLPIEINTDGGYAIGNSLHHKIINENLLNQAHIFQWKVTKRRSPILD